MWGREILLVSFALIALGITTKCPKRKTSPIREIFCYTSTFDVQLLTDSVCSCTTLVHQNHDVWNLPISHIVDFRKSLKEMHPPLQFVISIHDPAKTLRNSTIRQEAVAQIIAIMKEVDGVEMNVTVGSKERLYNFVKSLKDEMIRKSYDKRIFMTLPSKSEDLAKQFDIKELIKYIDLFTLPTDYLTDEDSAFVTFHPSRLIGLFDMLNTDSLVDLISGLGAPKEKILMTLPANAYKFILKHEDENAPRSQTTEKEPTPIDRKQLCEAINSGEWTVERDEDLTAPYAFQNKTWIAFEDKISVGIKGKYALLRDLAGLAVRNIESDMKTECEKPLTEEIYHSFTEFKRKSRQAVLDALEDELHQTQFSYPNQAKTSTFRVARVVDTEGHIRAVRENTQTEFVCRRQGYFVHPKSCNRFYRCVKFNQEIDDYSVFEFDCPAGLSFDERTEVCVWPGSLPQGSPCPGSSEIAPVAPKRFECSQPGYYADPQNCRWFFACIDLGEPELMAFEFRCPYGLVFDEKKLVCEWPWLVPACSESGSAYTRTEYDHRGYTAATSSGVGVGGYVTGGLPQYSTAETSYSDVDYSKTTGTGIHGVSHFGSTGYIDKHTGIPISGAETVSGHVGLSSSAGIDYSKSMGHGGSISSIPTYTGSSGIHVGSIYPSTIAAKEGDTRYSASSNRISNTGHTVSTDQTGYSISAGVNTGYANTGSLGGITTGFSGSTTRGYPGIVSGSHLTEGGITFSGTSGSIYPSTIAAKEGGTGYSASINRISNIGHTVSTDQTGYSLSAGVNTGYANIGSSYPNSIAGGYTGSVSASNPIIDTVSYPRTSETNHFGSIGSIDIRIGSRTSVPKTDRRYGGSTNVYTGSGTFTDGYSASTGVYSGATGRQPSFGESGPSFGTISGSSGAINGIEITGLTNRGYTGSTASYGDSTGAKYSKATSGFSTGSTGIDVNLSTSSEIRSSLQGSTSSDQVSGISSIPRHFGVIGDDRPHLNISVFGNEIPAGYEVQKGTTGTIFTGNSVEGSILTGDSFSGTVFSHGYIPGAISTSTVNQDTVLTGGVQPGYIATSSGTPGYVIRNGLKTVGVGSVSPGTLIYRTSTPAIAVSGPSTSDITLKDGISPGVVISGQTAPGVSVGGSIHSGTIESSTSKPYISQSGTIHSINSDGAATRGSVIYSSSTPNGGLTFTSPQGYRTDEGHGTGTFNAAYDINKYTGNDVLDCRPSSATLPDIMAPGGRIEGTGGIKPAVFTPSGFTKTGPTRTGITTAILGGGGSYSVSTSETRPALNSENISEKAFEGNVAGYTKTSSASNAADLSVTLTPPGYYSTAAPGGRVAVQSATSGYSYPKPTIQFGTSGVTFSPTGDNLPVTTPTSFLSVNAHNGPLGGTNVFGSKISTVPAGRRPKPTIMPIIYTTEHPEIYKTTLFEATKIPVSTIRPIDTGYHTVISPTNIPVSVLTDDRFTQQTGSSQTVSTPIFSIDLGVPFQRTDSSGQKDYSSSSSPVLGYLPSKSTKSDVIASTAKYDVPTVTTRPKPIGITYKKPFSASDITYQSPFSVTSPTTFKPPNVYYSGQGFSTASSLGTTISSGSPTNLDISRDKIDKLITNYDRGTVKYTPTVYDTFGSSRFGSTNKFSSPLSSTKSSFSVKTDSNFVITTPSGPTTLSYEVTTKSPEGKSKVIVKWSDLHPLLLSKLGAECTCKADPFATLRGPGKNLIASSKGKVDLANYEESEIYVDLENSSEDDYSEENDYITNYSDYSQQPYKISQPKTTSVTTDSTNLPSSSYLPPMQTDGVKKTTIPYVPHYYPSSHLGRSLKDFGPSPNLITSDQEDPDQIINGATDCARPGLFRHPSLCNKFYACHWDQWKKKFTLHIFNCPVHLTFDSSASACNWPSKGPACQAGNLLV